MMISSPFSMFIPYSTLIGLNPTLIIIPHAYIIQHVYLIPQSTICTYYVVNLLRCDYIQGSVKVRKSRKKICCPGFFQKTNAGAILCTENYPRVHFLEESRTP